MQPASYDKGIGVKRWMPPWGAGTRLQCVDRRRKRLPAALAKAGGQFSSS